MTRDEALAKYKVDHDLSEANLHGANLHGADLHAANLRWATLRGANLRWATLGGADLRWATLGGADLHWADLREADLRWADLHGADLGGANLSGADLGGANLRGADLRWADLRGADLRWADLREANLGRANLGGANLGRANLGGAVGLITHQIVPSHGAFTAFKQLRDKVIVELLIPADAQRVGGLVGRKCRASRAIVVSGAGYSYHDRTFEYKPGATIEPDSFDPSPTVECSNGIHFFITREEAEQFT